MLNRRDFLKATVLGTTTLLGSRYVFAEQSVSGGGTSVADLPRLKGKLTLYLGRGEGGLYENVLEAIQDRNPDLELGIRRGPTAALANAIVAEAQAGIRRADLFWAVDTGAIGLINGRGLAAPLPKDIPTQLRSGF